LTKIVRSGPERNNPAVFIVSAVTMRMGVVWKAGSVLNILQILKPSGSGIIKSRMKKSGLTSSAVWTASSFGLPKRLYSPQRKDSSQTGSDFFIVVNDQDFCHSGCFAYWILLIQIYSRKLYRILLPS